MGYVKPGVYTKKIDLSEVQQVYFCDCCDRAFKKKSYYLNHIRNKKLKKIKSNLSS